MSRRKKVKTTRNIDVNLILTVPIVSVDYDDFDADWQISIDLKKRITPKQAKRILDDMMAAAQEAALKNPLVRNANPID